MDSVWLYPIRFQWIEWAMALFFLGGIARYRFRVAKFFSAFEKKIQKNFPRIIISIVTFYFAVAVICKISQLFVFQLHAFDFWLFEDLIDQISRGGFMITRFAPQEPSWIQHGAVHTFWPLVILTPLVLIFGSLTVTLVFNPLVISASGYILDRWMEKLKLSALDRLIILLSFLFSFSISEMVMQEMHPELLYPLFLFSIAWAWHVKNQAWLMVLGFLLGSFKEDALILGLPFLISLQMYRPDLASLRSAGMGLGFGYAFEWASHIAFQKGYWGTHRWLDMPVRWSQSGAYSHAIDWSSISSIGNGISGLTGGFTRYLASFSGFLFHSTTLLFLGACVWVLLRPAFWVAFLPYALAFSVMGEKARLTNYYAAPFVAIFWVWVAIEFSRKDRWKDIKRSVLFLMVMAIGSVGLVAYVPRSPTPEIHEAVRMARFHLQEQGIDQGVVASPFIAFIPKEKIYSDRPPIRKEDEGRIEFMLLPRGWASYEIPWDQLKRLEGSLRSNRRWKEVALPSQHVQLWVKAK